jgi:hypothetical protein
LSEDASKADFRRYSEKKRNVVKSTMSKFLMLGFALLLATSSFAANQGSFNLSKSATVSGTELTPGDYKVKWDGTGPNVELMILKEGKLVATVPAQVVELNNQETNDATESRTNQDGSRSLLGIKFRGKKYELSFGSESMMSGSEPSATGNQ